MLAFCLGDTGLEIADVAQNLLSRILQRSVDDDAVAEPLAEPGGGVIFGVEFGKRGVNAAAAHGGQRVGHFLGGCRPHADAAQPLEDVEGPVDALGEFAVADDVDAGIGLLAHHFGDGFGQAGFERAFIVRLTVLDRAPEFDQLGRPDPGC